MIIEGLAKIELPKQTSKISKEQVVFYNPVMRVNRDISVLVVKTLKPKSCALPMAASGIRGIRFLKETSCKNVYMNDLSLEAIELISANCQLNDVSSSLENMDANDFIMSHTGFDYIDIDPFGSPNLFLQSSIIRISRGGILAVTATDTAPLCGTYPKTCIRKYWANPIRNELMHEIGLRILIRKVQMIASQFDKALTPILSYYKDHYFRIFFECSKGKKKCDELFKQHKELFFNSKTGAFSYSPQEHYNIKVGPFWSGKLFKENFVSNLISNISNDISTETSNFLNKLNDEDLCSENLLLDLHALSKRNLFKVPKTSDVIHKIKKLGFNATKTHFNNQSFKTNMPVEEVLEFLK